jgi:hypothetical protein
MKNLPFKGFIPNINTARKKAFKIFSKIILNILFFYPNRVTKSFAKSNNIRFFEI